MSGAPPREDTSPADLCLTRSQARAVDRYAAKVLGLPTVVLMENAGINAAGVVVDLLRREFVVDAESARVAVLCGGGSNGGDGYVVARQLKGFGLRPRVYSTHDPERLSGDAATNAAAWIALGDADGGRRGRVMRIDDPVGLAQAASEWRGCHVVVDALLGTGYSADRGPLKDTAAAVVEAVNSLTPESRAGSEPAEGFGGRVVALDVPSGLDADTGRPGHASAVRADVTVTFVAPKAGYSREGAEAYLGRVVVADIGVPESAVHAALAWDRERQ